MNAIPDIITPVSRNQADVVSAMQSCLQSRGQSVLAHGISVRRHYLQLLDVLRGDVEAPEGWRIPKWAYREDILGAQLPEDIVAEYQVYHDCGKPYARIEDEEGVHFPDHARASERVWLQAGGNPLAARLMAMDMDAHLLRADGLAEFAARDEAPTLLLTALAEVHSNAIMFGGLTSDSFKMKAKHLDKRGRQVLALRAAA